MLEGLRDRIEILFTVKQEKQTGKGILISFIIAVLIFISMPIYFRYEDYAYGRFQKSYHAVKDRVMAYYEVHGAYPQGNEINWEQEKNLARFFEANGMDKNRRLFYLDTEWLSELGQLKETYLIDIDYGMIYTSDFQIFHFARWHYAVDL